MGSPEERDFLVAGRALADIPVVKRFEQLRQASPTNDFDFGLSMEFDDHAANDACNAHPVHAAFVVDRWVPEVDDFLEIDYTPLGSRRCGWSRTAQVCARPSAQQVGQPRRRTTAGTSRSSDQPPTHGISTKAASINGRPTAPRTR